MKKSTLSLLAILLSFVLCGCISASYIERDYEANLTVLRSSAPYCADDASFEFVNRIDEEHAEEIRAYFKANTSLDLYSIAASDKTTWEKTYEIAVFAASIPHDNQKVQPSAVDAPYLWEYFQKYPTGFNCRLHSLFLSDLLFAAGIQNRFITCMSSDPDDGDCHVVNIVWLSELDKWTMIDADFHEYWTDEDGIPMSLEEMRNCLITETPHTINLFLEATAPAGKQYLEKYWAKNLYYFASHTMYGFNLEGKGRLPDDCYVALVPPDFQMARDYGDVYTTDAACFWAPPPITDERENVSFVAK